MRLVYLSPIPWNSFAQRPHKFAHWFHSRTGGAVLWVDPYPTRFPNLGDLRRLAFAASPSKQSNTPRWLKVLKPGGLPIEPMIGSGSVNGFIWRRSLGVIDGFTEGHKCLLAIGKPSVFALRVLELLSDCSSLYDAMDDFPAFYSGFSRFALMRREREVAQRVGIILASSSSLKAKWASSHGDVRLVHNALDALAIRRAVSVSKRSEKKIFGYVGTIASWFDWEWVCALAEERPDDEVRLIGPLIKSPSRKLPDNISLRPECSHKEAIDAMVEFSVGLIPFKINKVTASVDPIKYYEYRALGLPVISTDFGEMSLRVGMYGLFISKSTHDLAVLAESAACFISRADDASGFLDENTWSARFDAAMLL